MAVHNQLGKRGEAIAKKCLQERGYEILTTNWRFKRAEIDLIARDQDILVFVEIKTRSYDFFGAPEAFVTTKKEQLMFEAANAYMEQIGHNWEIRFDIIGIILPEQGTIQVRHFKDAFFPSV